MYRICTIWIWIFLFPSGCSYLKFFFCMADSDVKLEKVFLFTKFAKFSEGENIDFSNIQSQIGLKHLYMFHLGSAWVLAKSHLQFFSSINTELILPSLPSCSTSCIAADFHAESSPFHFHCLNRALIKLTWWFLLPGHRKITILVHGRKIKNI